MVPQRPESRPDLRLVRRAGSSEPELAGEQLPLDALYQRFAPYVAAIAMRILGREGEVEDVVQDVFVCAVRSLRRRENHAEIKRWLATVAVRRSIRRLRLRALWSLVDLAEEPSWDRVGDPSASLEERRLVARVYRVLDTLPIRERVPWTLRHVEGASLEEVAELCGCSLATTKRRIARAHAKINLRIEGKAERESR